MSYVYLLIQDYIPAADTNNSLYKALSQLDLKKWANIKAQLWRVNVLWAKHPLDGVNGSEKGFLWSASVQKCIRKIFWAGVRLFSSG